MRSSRAPSTDIPSKDERWASRRPPRRVIVVGLAFLAVLQAIAYISAPADGPAPFVTEAHDLSDLSLRDSHGTLQALDAGQPTLLLVFDPACVHSRGVATHWSSWFAGTTHDGYRIIAISPDNAAAAQYMRERQWPAVVTSVEPIGHVIARRTPWAFAVDGQGRVVAEGHGKRLGEVAQAFVTRKGT